MCEDVMQKSEVKWVHVDDALPEIPKGKYGIHVLAVFYDPNYDEENEERCWYVSDCSYASVVHNRYYEHTDLRFDFVDLYTSTEYDEEDWGPTGDKVVYWAYLPEPPKILIKPKL